MPLDVTTSQGHGASAEEEWTPETVLSTLPDRPETHTSSPVPFFHILERLKTTKREGWRRFGITSGESIADHMYRMSIISLLAPASLKLDTSRCVKMALVHDMAESLVGDITPVDGVPKAEKSRREEITMDYLCKDLLGNCGLVGTEEIRTLWTEYEDSKTLESQFVHDVDKIELMLQMVEYERAGKGSVDLAEFLRVGSQIVFPQVREWFERLVQERKAFWDSVGKRPEGVLEITPDFYKYPAVQT
ncbi:putative HD family hydrolase [Trichodelitschia bisporula]|uniref:5'-deoxynucleotidase n=1 Tax=Trichodelitschia bisporula TaxID=703511 RepID=A0A6G1I5C3_9PEZI|nr:putative HD family hydrolase [Trichodelitschia bisporula]